ncbi:stAR-related lipid transfer protein 9 isoform C [Patagioenas fasciata monilis]|uniref:StAR-related lipid transfer protein 9 n=1 Tax=Patagioenas fasciata monilis TaxID=372326 RepID=A0A1V4KF79_PATFA|nr:stAR-related lipid transfer protein 9 isoform C [Patagioenas fasciata monilis]
MANVKVAVRVRPLSKRESAEGGRVIVEVDDKVAKVRNIKVDSRLDSTWDSREKTVAFSFDYCYWSVDPEDPKYASQEMVFQDLGTSVLSGAFKGYNICLFAYGQTGSGKTYTMMGTPASIGLTPRICEGLFSRKDDYSDQIASCRVKVSFLEIYNERVRDLLKQSDQKKPYTLRVREHPETGPYVQGLTQHLVTDYKQVVELLEEGIAKRITAATHIHNASSRSHAIFTIHYTQAILENHLPSEIASKINLVDLAGSERADPSYCKDRITEGANINKSLVTLGIVISTLAQNSQMFSSCQSINTITSEGESSHVDSPATGGVSGTRRPAYIPYRDSILTWLLKDSLGGNSKTIMIATISPASSSYNETMSTLRYASNAKNIINKPRVNEDANVKLIRELREEIDRLKTMLMSFELRNSSPSWSDDRDSNLTELVLQNEMKIEQLTKDWTSKWTDRKAIMEEYSVDINKEKAGVKIASSFPHLMAMDDDILSTGVVLYHLREGTTKIGRSDSDQDQDIVLQGWGIERDHCMIDNNGGIVTLRPVPGARCAVNGCEVTGSCRLSQGALVVLGKSHKFRFNHPAEAAILRQRRSINETSPIPSCGALDWLKLDGSCTHCPHYILSSLENQKCRNCKENEFSLELSREIDAVHEEYKQKLRDQEAFHRKQIQRQQLYVEDLKQQILRGQIKAERELENDQALINQQIQENQQWLINENKRLAALQQQQREFAVQTESALYVEAEVQSSIGLEICPSLLQQNKKRLVQLELLRRHSLKKAERNIRRKKVKFQLERIVKKQKLLEAKQNLEQLEASCWFHEECVKQSQVLNENNTVQSSLDHHLQKRRRSLQQRQRSCGNPRVPQVPSYLLKRETVSKLSTSPNIGQCCESNTTGRLSSVEYLYRRGKAVSGNDDLNDEKVQRQLTEKQKPSSSGNKRGGEEYSNDLGIMAYINKNDQKIAKLDDNPGEAGSQNQTSKGSSPDLFKEKDEPETFITGTRMKKTKVLGDLNQPASSNLEQNRAQVSNEKTRMDINGKGHRSSLENFPKEIKKTVYGNPRSANLNQTAKNWKRELNSTLPSHEKSSVEQQEFLMVATSVGNLTKMNTQAPLYYAEKRWHSAEMLSAGVSKTATDVLGNWQEDEENEISDTDSSYSVDSLSCAYAKTFTEKLKQEDFDRNKCLANPEDSESDDSQILADGEEMPAEDLVEESKSDSSDEVPAEIYWKLQTPRSPAIQTDEDHESKACDRDTEGTNYDLKLSSSFYLDTKLKPACKQLLEGTKVSLVEQERSLDRRLYYTAKHDYYQRSRSNHPEQEQLNEFSAYRREEDSLPTTHPELPKDHSLKKKPFISVVPMNIFEQRNGCVDADLEDDFFRASEKDDLSDDYNNLMTKSIVAHSASYDQSATPVEVSEEEIICMETSTDSLAEIVPEVPSCKDNEEYEPKDEDLSSLNHYEYKNKPVSKHYSHECALADRQKNSMHKMTDVSVDFDATILLETEPQNKSLLEATEEKEAFLESDCPEDILLAEDDNTKANTDEEITKLINSTINLEKNALEVKSRQTESLPDYAVVKVQTSEGQCEFYTNLCLTHEEAEKDDLQVYCDRDDNEEILNRFKIPERYLTASGLLENDSRCHDPTEMSEDGVSVDSVTDTRNAVMEDIDAVGSRLEEEKVHFMNLVQMTEIDKEKQIFVENTEEEGAKGNSFCLEKLDSSEGVTQDANNTHEEHTVDLMFNKLSKDCLNSIEDTAQEKKASSAAVLIASNGDKGDEKKSNSTIKETTYAQDNKLPEKGATTDQKEKIIQEANVNSKSSSVAQCSEGKAEEAGYQPEAGLFLQDNKDTMHFSSSDINPYIHPWQQDGSCKIGWKHSYATAKVLSSTLSSIEGLQGWDGVRQDFQSAYSSDSTKQYSNISSETLETNPENNTAEFGNPSAQPDNEQNAKIKRRGMEEAVKVTRADSGTQTTADVGTQTEILEEPQRKHEEKQVEPKVEKELREAQAVNVVWKGIDADAVGQDVSKDLEQRHRLMVDTHTTVCAKRLYHSSSMLEVSGHREVLTGDLGDHSPLTRSLRCMYVTRRGKGSSSGIGHEKYVDDNTDYVTESDCDTEILLNKNTTFTKPYRPRSYSLRDLPIHNKFSNWCGVKGSPSPSSLSLSSSVTDLQSQAEKKPGITRATEMEGKYQLGDSRSREIERLQRERARIMSGLHLDLHQQPLTVELAEAKLSYGIGETDALLRVLQSGTADDLVAVPVKQQLYERHMRTIETLRKEREKRLQRYQRSRSLSPQKHLSLLQTLDASRRDPDLPSRRREYLQQLRRDVVENTRVQEPKRRSIQHPSDIELLLRDYQRAREETKSEIARARDKLRERAEQEKKRIREQIFSQLQKEEARLKTLASTSTLCTDSSLSLSSGPTSGYNSSNTATYTASNLSSQDQQVSSGNASLSKDSRGRSAVRNSQLYVLEQLQKDSTFEAVRTQPPLPSSSISCRFTHGLTISVSSSSTKGYQDLSKHILANATTEVMAACSHNLRNLYTCQAAAGWKYQCTEKEVLVYYKVFPSATRHGFLGAGVIERPLPCVWGLVRDPGKRHLYDRTINTARIHKKVTSHIQLVYLVTDTSLCYLKQPRDFCCITVEAKEENLSVLAVQSVYDASMPHPCKEVVRGEILPSAWILEPDVVNGRDITRVIYMAQVDLGAPAIPARLLSSMAKRQPLVIARLAHFLAS